MQTKLSKTLEGLVARAAFDAAKSGMTRNLGDFLALAMLREEGAMAYQILSARLKEWEVRRICEQIEQGLNDSAAGPGESPGDYYSRFVQELTDRFPEEPHVGSAHALRFIVEGRESLTAQALELYGIDAQTLAAETARFVAGDGNRPNVQVHLLDFSEESRPANEEGLLDKFGVDLTRQAREGKIDPVIGRTREIDRVVQILSRRRKNNPVLLGEAGVGKSAIVEGLALRMAAGEVPYTIAGKRLFSLDVSSLVAGTKFRGEFEERMQQLIDELRRSHDVIVFIDEIHTIVGAGSTQGSLDTANILKPVLARGEIQTIGATTLDEYRENIERDAALERRFQRVVVEPTTEEETLEILRNIAPRYEAHHKVRYTEEALKACIALTGRYVTDRNFPDKAIDVLDEAGARVHIRTANKPGEIRRMEEAIATARRERQQAVETLVYEQAASARMRELALRSKLGERRAAWHRALEEHPAEITAADIQQVITSMTGIPAERVAGSETGRLQGLGGHLSSRVIGQQEAVDRLSKAILRSRTGLRDERRPIGVFLFVGPTGVGKTLLAKELSKWLFDERRGLIRLDMSEYGEKHNVARLIGSPPGYVGYGEGGQLTEAVRRHPYSVVLFDEIEKAHPEVFNTLLQLFDEGCLTDGSGRRVDFRNTVIIMTSNVGSREAVKRSRQVGFTTPSKHCSEQAAPGCAYRQALERTFAPEFLNRIDDVVVFHTLEPQDVERIIELELEGLHDRAERLGYRIRITPTAKRRLAEMGYESRYGARALKRTLTEQIEEPLTNLVIRGDLKEGDTVVVESDKGRGIHLRVA